MQGVTAKRTGNILIVEDDLDCATVIATVLTDDGFGVRMVASRDEALQVLGYYAYHVVIMDLYMPGLGPKEFINEVRRRHATSEVILLTAAEIVPKAVKDLDLCHSLGKPFQPSELLQAVKKCLASGDDGERI
jgi:DNA-binding NtrC family response regulator